MKKLFIAVLAALAITPAFAGVSQRCNDFANFAYSVTVARDTGVEQSTLQSQVFTLINEGKTRQFVASDKIELGRIITILYNHPTATPEYAARSYFQHCLETSADL